VDVYQRLAVVCHVWPGITPFNVFQLPYDMWVGFAKAADDYEREMKESDRG
jgi:hypothetical protein